MEARLVNRQTGESTIIDKPVFRIGRERNYVDLLVDNPTVSRAHCNLIRRNNTYYLVDMDSTNHTYVNGVVLKPRQETCLGDGDELTLANEKFVFRCIPRGEED